jgi:hypothetical protein
MITPRIRRVPAPQRTTRWRQRRSPPRSAGPRRRHAAHPPLQSRRPGEPGPASPQSKESMSQNRLGTRDATAAPWGEVLAPPRRRFSGGEAAAGDGSDTDDARKATGLATGGCRLQARRIGSGCPERAGRPLANWGTFERSTPPRRFCPQNAPSVRKEYASAMFFPQKASDAEDDEVPPAGPQALRPDQREATAVATPKRDSRPTGGAAHRTWALPPRRASDKGGRGQIEPSKKKPYSYPRTCA